MPKTLGGLMEILNPNHVDLDLYYPIGWSNSQTHPLHKATSPFANCPVTLILPGLLQIDPRYTDHVM